MKPRKYVPPQLRSSPSGEDPTRRGRTLLRRVLRFVGSLGATRVRWVEPMDRAGVTRWSLC